MNGASGFQEVESSDFRLQSYRFRASNGIDSEQAPGNFSTLTNLIARSTVVSTKRETLPDSVFIPTHKIWGGALLKRGYRPGEGDEVLSFELRRAYFQQRSGNER